MNSDNPPEKIEITNAIKKFVESKNQILLLSGAFAQCMCYNVNHVRNILITQTSAETTTIIVPAARMLEGYDQAAVSIYGLIYEKDSYFCKEELKFIHNKKVCNEDSHNHVYIVANAHLISDSLQGINSRRFGSDHLLSDLMEFIDLCGTKRQIIFILDPYQLSKGSSESKLSITKLRKYSKSVDVPIKNFKCLHGATLFLQNRELIAKRILTHQFSRLNIRLGKSECTQLSDTSNKIDRLVKNDKVTIVAYTNAQVNQYNQAIRRRVFGRESQISEGDLVVLHNHIEFLDEECLLSFPVTSGSFGTVTKIYESESIEQPLKGRDKPVKVNFLKIDIRWKKSGRIQKELLCFEDFLYREKPEIAPDEWLALVVHARDSKKSMEESNEQNEKTRQQSKNHENEEKEHINSPYLRAAMIRFGYAITLHRAQGCLFKTVIADLSEKTSMGGGTYFRWLYTAFSVPEQSLYLINVPRKSPFDKTIWELDKSRLDPSIQSPNSIAYDPSAPNPTQIIQSPTNCNALRNLYGFIRHRMKRMNVQISAISHHQFLEIYTFERDDKNTCILHLYYNGKFEITRVQIKKSQPPDFAMEILDALSSKLVFHTTFQQEIHDFLCKKLNYLNIVITAVKHQNFHEIYFIEGSEGKAKFRAHYNKAAAVTKVTLMEHSSENFRKYLKRIFKV